jgi:signal transduction histidine kinase
MKGRVRIPLFVLSLVLLGLIGLLGTLQYRWLGRISQAEHERMRATLETGAAAFAQDFDAELTRAYLLFGSHPFGETDDMLARFSARYDRWQATARFPRIIKAFYSFDPGVDAGPRKFDPALRTFVETEWPPSMRDWRAHLSVNTSGQASPMREGGTLFIRRMPSPVWESAPAVVVPSPTIDSPGEPLSDPPRLTFAVLELDEPYIAEDVLPALAEQHFTRVSGTEFQVAVVSRGRGERVIYRSQKSFNPVQGATADATAGLFSVRTQDFSRVASEIHRFTAFASTLQGRGTNRPGRTPPPDSRRVAIVIERGAPADSSAPPAAPGVTSASGGEAPAATSPSWQLMLVHHSGSLEAAVATARRRNLLVSSSILGVLGASMGLLLLATRRAQRLARQQMEFVGTVSHELRTPLAVIRSAADNLAAGIVRDDAQVRRYGELVRDEGRRLTDMVEQVLEFSGLQSGEQRLNAAPVAVAPLIQEIVDASAPLTRAAGITVRVDVPPDLPPVLGDEPALGRVIRNLFANAVKYGAAGGWIGVEAGREGDNVLITIADRGMGITAADQARIFEPFYRAPAAVDAQIQGAGLGLSLVSRIVAAHGGAVSVRSEPGQGAAFAVQLPVADFERARGAADGGRQPAAVTSGTKAPRYS